jgi:serine/threonine protein kinase
MVTLLQNRYRILRQIGGGGMGIVYVAEDTRLPGHHCAIKEVSPAALVPEERAWAIRAFQQEAQILARLSHLGLTAVTDFFPEAGNWYLVMDYVDGDTLEDRLKKAQGGRLPLKEALSITRQLCDVLGYLHAQSPPVVFRDLKPGNVMITPRGEVKLIDFGIARFFKPGQTQDTVNLGTPGYAAPEQYGGRGQTDPRSDVYGLGVLLHQMLTGYDPTTTPFNLPPPRQLNPNIAPCIEAAIQQALQVNVAERLQSVKQFRSTLWSPPPKPFPWKVIAGVAGAIIALLACSAIFAYAIKPWSSTARTPQIPSTSPAIGPTQTPVVIILTPTPFPPTYTPVPTLAPTAGPPSPDIVFVPAGTFIRGSTRADIQAVVSQLCVHYTDRWCQEGSFEDELTVSEVPAQKADVSYMDSRDVHLGDFYIDRYEVTNAEYALCVQAGACSPPDTAGSNPRRRYFADSRYDDCPVVYVAWHQAQAYCTWAGARLPTAAEWEKAARGTDGRWWPWGNQVPTTEANLRQPGEDAATEEDTALMGGNLAPAGAHPADRSPYDAMDLAGNVMEWVDSWYGPGKREIRGGSWNTGSFALRTANRTGRDPNDVYFDVGFRCARDTGP